MVEQNICHTCQFNTGCDHVAEQGIDSPPSTPVNSIINRDMIRGWAVEPLDPTQESFIDMIAGTGALLAACPGHTFYIEEDQG